MCSSDLCSYSTYCDLYFCFILTTTSATLHYTSRRYPSTGEGEEAPRDARLFSASTATGTFKVEEVDQFDQGDLNDEDVFLLDTYTQLFVWIGSQSTQQEKDKAMAFAQQYAASADDGRDPDLPIIRVTAGDEPRMFSCHFHGWDDAFFSKRSFKDPYQVM